MLTDKEFLIKSGFFFSFWRLNSQFKIIKRRVQRRELFGHLTKRVEELSKSVLSLPHKSKVFPSDMHHSNSADQHAWL